MEILDSRARPTLAVTGQLADGSSHHTGNGVLTEVGNVNGPINDLLTERLGERIQLVGDDIFVTTPAIITDAIERGIANSAPGRHPSAG